MRLLAREATADRLKRAVAGNTPGMRRPLTSLSIAVSVLACALAAAVGSATAGGGGDHDRGGGGDRGARPSTYVIPGDRVFPEGIAMAPHGRAFYVGSTTDGAIFRGDVRSGEMKPFAAAGADGRTTAIGMKAAGHKRLVVAGGGTGKVFVLDRRDGSTIAVLDTAPGGAATFLNDVALAGKRTAFVTDSQRPILFRVTLGKDDVAPTIEPFMDFTGTAFAYQSGFNANGIVAAKGGRILLIVQSNTGRIFRVDTRTKQVERVDLGDAALTNDDGLVLRGRTLFVVRNQQELLVPVKLSRDLRRGRVGDGFTSEALRFPTTAAFDGHRLLVVNSQFDRRASDDPVLPFTVSAIPVRGAGKHGRHRGDRDHRR